MVSVKEWINGIVQERLHGPITGHIREGWTGFVDQFSRDLFDFLVVLCIFGIFLNMAGNRGWGRKLTGGSILVGLVYKVVFFRG